MTKHHRIAVIPGDGIGKEVVPEGIRALEAVGRKFDIGFEWRELFTSDPAKMGPFVNPKWLSALAWMVAVIIAVLNIWLLYQTFTG